VRRIALLFAGAPVAFNPASLQRGGKHSISSIANQPQAFQADGMFRLAKGR